ncbi:MAG: MBL fold metallo-hydrolase [Luteitalea sp.]|nr:MBL fold metallo-hydrolase [Luteitalea sp.]
MKRSFVLGMLIAIGALSIAVAAVQDAGRQGGRGRGGRGAQPEGLLAADAGQWREGRTTRLVKLRDNVYRINNTGSNLTAFVTDAGVVIVESGYPGWTSDVLAKIKSVTDKPLTMVINTHAHGDHASMNPELGKLAGNVVEFVAHEYAAKMMGQDDCSTLSGAGASACNAFKGENRKYLPGKTVKDKLSLKHGNLPIELAYYGPAHTNGDIVVTFPTLRMAHVGDLFAWPGVPRLFVEDGGSTIQFGETLRKAQAGTTNVDTIITGHSQVKTFQDWVDQRLFVDEYVGQVLAAHKAGKTVEEAVAGFKYSAKWSVCPPTDTFASQYPEDHEKFHTQCTYRTDQTLTDTKYAYGELDKKK